MHGALELAKGAAVVGEVRAAVDKRAVVGETLGVLRADEGDVAECGGGEGRSGGAAGIVVALETVALAAVGNMSVAHYEAILHVAAEAVVGVEVVVPALVGYEILSVDCAAEPLERVVVRVGHLNVVELRAVAHRTERKAVDFLVGLEGIACKFDTHVAERARVVGRIAAAVLGARTAFNLCFAGVVGSFAADDEAAPVAGLAVALFGSRGEYDRSVGCAASPELTAALYDERSFRLLVAADHGARLDGQFRAIGNVHPAAQGIRALGESLLAFEHKFLVTVADNVAFEEKVVGCFHTVVFAPVAFFCLRSAAGVLVVAVFIIVAASAEESGGAKG